MINMTGLKLIKTIYGVDTEISTRANVLIKMMRTMPDNKDVFKDTFEYKQIIKNDLMYLFLHRGMRQQLLSELISLTSIYVKRRRVIR